MNKIDWFGCYDGSWQSAPLVAEAYAHPAKVSFNLAERIYRHMLAEGWLTPGAQVVDPFGGIGGLAFHAALYGMHWTGVELEAKFVALAEQNLALWRERYGPHFPSYGTARILQGDSRHLAALIGGADGAVSSPPFQESLGKGGETKGFHSYDENESMNRCKRDYMDYGTTPGQLGALPAGDFDAAVSSPPFQGTSTDDPRPYGGLIDPSLRGSDGVILKTYGSTSGNLGNDTPDTFWVAAREIVAQTYAVLRPGAVAAWITGDFVRNKQRVPFGEQWLSLCESVGFEPLAWAVAWKQTDHGAQLDIFGEAIPQTTTRVSFFRRLANQKNPAAAILNEDVIFVRKPGGAGMGWDGSVSSPPFVGVTATQDPDFLTPGEQGKRVPSKSNQADYGATPGQLGAMPAGDAP